MDIRMIGTIWMALISRAKDMIMMEGQKTVLQITTATDGGWELHKTRVIQSISTGDILAQKAAMDRGGSVGKVIITR